MFQLVELSAGGFAMTFLFNRAEADEAFDRAYKAKRDETISIVLYGAGSQRAIWKWSREVKLPERRPV